MKQQDSFGTLCSRLGVKFLGSSVKCADAFRIALTEEAKLLIKQKYSKDCQLSIFFIIL